MLRTHPVTPNDEAFLYRLYVSTRIAEVAAWGWEESAVHAFLRMQWEAQKQSYGRSHPNAVHRVIARGHISVGRILLSYEDQAILLIDISVLPEFRSQGIGTQIIKSIQLDAGETAKTVRLHVLKVNPAKRLYEHLGFTVVGSNEIYESMEWRVADQHDAFQ